ncbi:hypothetical protein CVT24_003336 [Panaeolus cyanescens]|uniref:PH domain-containing protein n=1 Tax=Panaeolus cyanescens TaxID=181874 RepID=A0A409Y747_9AGAR|nr:hypothetical protein CVT24_003336 [Panaeolus cyanescens]
MASRKVSLKDRLLSNSPDPIKSSILRESGMGWNSSSQPSSSITSSGSNGSITSPLRIAKRDSETRSGPIVARRTSSSYRHVHTNNLVSKSPFKSQIPTPATPSRSNPVIFPTRRVSGEKRPRPSSMHELGEDENDRPFALKRERTQSKTFQGLIEKEPVTKSPFRSSQFAPVSNTRAAQASPAVPPLPSSIPTTHTSTPPRISQIPTPVANTAKGPSPGRSALVSRRMHGPRLSGGPKMERRKTVTFHERCDVLEFDRDESMEYDENAVEDDEDDANTSHESNDDIFFPSPQNIIHDNHDHDMQDETSYESIQLSDTGLNPIGPSLLSDPDASITGIVEQMFFASNAPSLADTSAASYPDTPPRHNDLPTDLETEDGVPFGRSHHVERFLQHQEQHHSPRAESPHFSPKQSPTQVPSTPHSPSSYPFNLGLPTRASPLGPPATPPRRSPAIRHSTPPLGRSTHLDRAKRAHEDMAEECDEVIERLPASPTSMKHSALTISPVQDSLTPACGLQDVSTGQAGETSANISVDRFAPRLQDESLLSDFKSDESSDDSHHSSIDNISIGNSEINLSALASEKDCNEVLESLQLSPLENSTNAPNSIFRSVAQHGSPASRSASPLLGVPDRSLTKSTSRERISRAEVQRRLIQRNSVSPAPDRGSPYSSPKSFLRPTPERSDTLLEVHDKDRDRLSVLTTQTDFSTETAIVQTVEKRNLGFTSLSPTMEEDVQVKEFGLLESNQRLHFDFGSKFSIGGLALPSTDADTVSVDSKDTFIAPERQAAPTDDRTSDVKMAHGDVDMDMKSALDRLMEDVAGAGVRPDDSMTTDDGDASYDHSRDHASPIDYNKANPRMLERAATDSILMHHNEADGIISRSVSGASTISGPPPPVPPKDSIRSREQLILEKRREARRMQEDSDDDMATSRGQTQKHLGVGRPSRRRSMSTGDAEVLGGGAKRRGEVLLDIPPNVDGEGQLADSIEKELKKLVEQPSKTRYHVRERAATIYASSSTEQVSHSNGAGDLNAGRAWRAVRRPSDMNEYAKQIREYRAQDKGKAYGKVFVKVVGIRGMNLPLPDQPTAVTCTLNNGIHFVTTPECQLSDNCRIEQEFELIEHSKLEFTLTLKVRRDPHIIAQFKAVSAPPAAAMAPPPPPPPVVQSIPVKTGVMRSFFSSSPKKSKEKVAPIPRVIQPLPQTVHRLPENLARHLKPDGTLARAFISFKDVATRCDMRLFETSYPLIGQRVEVGGKFSTLEVGEIVLQMFRLPPLPGIPQEQLPQSLEECHRGLRHINWHKVTYFQGTLTQSGGDCITWRRRQLRIIGANLVAFNDVTKKATATIDLKKAIDVIDDQEARNRALSPSSPRGSRFMDDDEMYGVERSFRLVFPGNQEIIFFADTDEEKSRWLEVLRALVGHIPPHPLWAELLWQRQEEISRRMTAAQQSIPQPQAPLHASGRPPFR